MLPAALLCQRRERRTETVHGLVISFESIQNILCPIPFLWVSLLPVQFHTVENWKCVNAKVAKRCHCNKPQNNPTLAGRRLVSCGWISPNVIESLSFSVCLLLRFWNLDAYLMSQTAEDAHLNAWTTPPCAKLSARTPTLQSVMMSCWVIFPSRV